MVHPPPRPRRQPGQHPAGRGDPAGDAAAGAALPHPPRPAVARHPKRDMIELPISGAEAVRLADDLERRSAEDVLRVAVDLFHPRLVLTCSWQKQSSVLVHMLSEIQPDVRVVEFDTGLLFRETYETRQKLIERYPVRFERIEPELSVQEQAAVHGDRLWERDPDGCCAMRKVAPLRQALDGMDAWITGIRRDQSTTRESARKIEIDERR